MVLALLLLCALTATGSDDSFPQRELLAAHNAVRARAGLPALVWSNALAQAARRWADALIARDQFSHSPNSPYGENLFEVRGAVSTPREVVQAWASEEKDYDYRSNRCRDTCGHYTQIVWRNTKSLGCAVSRNSRREVWVCNYDPPGNYAGQRPY
jgi:pathogenesis-related protein 1